MATETNNVEEVTSSLKSSSNWPFDIPGTALEHGDNVAQGTLKAHQVPEEIRKLLCDDNEFLKFITSILQLTEQYTNEEVVLDLVSASLEYFKQYAEDFLIQNGFVHNYLNCIFFSLVAEKYELLLKKCCNISRAVFKEIEVHLTGILLPVVECSRFVSLNNNMIRIKRAFLTQNNIEELVTNWNVFEKQQQNLVELKALFRNYNFGKIQLNLVNCLIKAFAKLKEELIRSREAQPLKTIVKTEAKTNDEPVEGSISAKRGKKTAKQSDKDTTRQQSGNKSSRQAKINAKDQIFNEGLPISDHASGLHSEESSNSVDKNSTSDLYAIMKDIGTLDRIIHYIDLAVTGEITPVIDYPIDKILVERTLQVTGEYLKSTEDTPHLSSARTELLHKAGVPIEKIASLRNLLSHCSTYLAFTQDDEDDATDGELLENVRQDLSKIKRLLLKVRWQLEFLQLKIWLLNSNIVPHCQNVGNEDYINSILNASNYKGLKLVFDDICQNLEQLATFEFTEVKESAKEIKFAMGVKAINKVIRRCEETLKQPVGSCNEGQPKTTKFVVRPKSISTLSSIKNLASAKGIDEFHANQLMGNKCIKPENADQLDCFISIVMDQLLSNSTTGAQAKKMLKKPKYGFASEFREYTSNSKIDSFYMLLLTNLANSSISSEEQSTLLDKFLDEVISGEEMIELMKLKIGPNKEILKFLSDFKQERIGTAKSKQVLTSIIQNAMRRAEEQLTTTEFHQLEEEFAKMVSVHMAKQKLLLLCNGIRKLEKKEFEDLALQLEKNGDIKQWDEYFTNRQGCKTKVSRVKDPYDTLLKRISEGKGFQETVKCFQEFSKELTLESDCKLCLNQCFSDEIEQHFINSFHSSIKALVRLQSALGLDIQSFDATSRDYFNSEAMRAVVEMLVLKCMTTLKEISPGVYWRLEKLIETSTSRLLGKQTANVSIKSLRNYLAHGDALVDTLNPDVNKSVLLTACILASNGHALVEIKNMMENPERITLLHRIIGGLQDTDLLSHISIKYVNQIEVINDSLYGKNEVWKADLLKVIRQEKSSETSAKSECLRIDAFLKMMKKELDNAICFNDLKMADFVISSDILSQSKCKMGRELEKAIENDSLEVITFLLKKGYEANADGQSNFTPLHFAVINGNAKATARLLDYGADVNAQDIHRLSALHWAAMTGQSEIINLLSQHGSRVNTMSNENRAPLHLASWSGHEQAVSALLSEGTDLDIPDKDFLTPLHFAAREGHEVIVAKLLGANAKVNGNISSEFTPLHSAVKYGHYSVVELLLDGGADVNSPGHQHCTPLHIALLSGNLDIANFLASRGAAIDKLFKDEVPPLHIAAKVGDVNIVKWLLQKGIGVEALDSYGRTALHVAAQGGHIEIGKLLLEEHADVNATGQHGLTPLHDAVENGHVQFCKFLLENGADANATNFKKKSTNDEDSRFTEEWPLMHASIDGDLDLVNSLIKYGADVNKTSRECITSLHCAACVGQLRVVTKLLESKASVDATNSDLQTPLHLAAKNGHHKVVEVLLQHAANVNAVDFNLVTALHLSAKQGHVAMTETLLINDASVNVVCYGKWTPLLLATESGYCSVLELLLGHGSDVASKDCLSAIHAATMFGQPEAIRTLLKHGCDVNITDKYGQTPLHFACLQGCRKYDDIVFSDRCNVDKSTKVEIIKIFLQEKANANIKDNFGNTPMHYAAESGDVDVIKVLLMHHGDPSAKDEWQNTPLQIAERFGHTDCCEYLSLNFKLDDNKENLTLVMPDRDLKATLGSFDLLDDSRTSDGDYIKRLCEAVHDGKPYLVKKLLDGSNDCSKDINNHYLLHTSVANGDSVIVEHLIKSGKADVNYIRNGDDMNPLHLAVQFGYVNIVKFMRDSGADVLARTKNELRTALHLAAQTGDKAIAQLLTTAKEIDIEAEDIDGKSPLFLACQSGNEAVVDLLLGKNAQVSHANKDGDAPIHVAVLNGDLKIIQTLLGSDATQTIAKLTGKEENFPLHYNMYNSNTEVAQLLLNHGASIDCVNQASETPLHVAVKHGHRSAVEFLLSKGAGVDGSFWAREDIETPLHLAAEGGNTEVVEILVKNRADVNAKNKQKRSALHIAVFNGHYDIADILCKTSARINSADINGYTPLLIAVQEQHGNVIRLLLDCGADVHATCDTEEWATIHLAVLQMDTEILQEVLKHGANANSVCKNGMTALHLAVWKEYVEGVDILLKNYANVNACDTAKRTPLHMACEQGCHDIIKCLTLAKAHVNLPNGEGRLPLFLATKMGTAESMQFLIDNGADVNAGDKNGITALHAAITRMDIIAVNVLLSNHADVNMLVEADMSYLHCACLVSSANVVRRLLEIDLNVNARMTDGSTPMHIAALRQNVDIVDALLEHRADINTSYAHNITPLRVAITKKNTIMAKHIMVRGANVHGLLEDDVTLLYHAADVGHNEIINTLLASGLAIDVPNSIGHTALHAAAGRGHSEVVLTLLKNKANINAADVEGRTPLHLACQQGHEMAVDALVNDATQVKGESDQKADINAVTADNITPLAIAIMHDQGAVAIKLIEMGADLSITTRAGDSSLSLALQNDLQDVVEKLREYGVDVNIASCSK